jgi:hypothetical protein
MNCTNVLGQVCNDNNACTDDVCNSNQATLATACSYSNVSCTPNQCQNVTGCNSTTGCVFSPFICPTPADFCQVSICDQLAGCINIPKTCVVSDADCYVGQCDSVAEQCNTVERPDWTTITTQQGGGVTCFAFYDKAATAGIITGGVVAGIVVGAVVFAALAAVAARKAYLLLQVRQGNMGAAQGNPLYAPTGGSGVNPMYN